jgi:NMD protein affecting ribosome stability and mRNA decay
MKATIPTTSRMDRLISERVHDPYQSGYKLREPSVCPDCNAVFRNGRWQWAESWPLNSRHELCQACRRIRDGYPAGVLVLRGSFTRQHKVEVLNLVRRNEADEKAEHPLHRIMKIHEGAAAITINTTDVHLPRRIGEALRRAFKGRLAIKYEEDTCFVRVNWSREK